VAVARPVLVVPVGVEAAVGGCEAIDGVGLTEIAGLEIVAVAVEVEGTGGRGAGEDRAESRVVVVGCEASLRVGEALCTRRFLCSRFSWPTITHLESHKMPTFEKVGHTR
jgi:hypothetical protein